jgi:2-dehydropantoate 2-reductase
MDSIAILGPGGVGGFLAAALARAGQPVTIVARQETAAHIAGHGLVVRSARLGDFAVHPPAVAALERPAGVLFVATKAIGLDRGLDRVQSEVDLVVPLLNGLDHMELLRERFGSDRVAAGAIRIESDRPAPGVIVQSSPFLRVDMASTRAELAPRLREVAAALELAEVPTTVSSSEAQILWSKLVRLNALALTTSAADESIGFIRSDPEWRAALEACIEEASAVARAEGAQMDGAARLAELDDAHPGLGSSMQRDIAAGREPELDAIAGAVLRAGTRHGLDCPTIARLSVRVAQRAGISPPDVGPQTQPGAGDGPRSRAS